MQRMKKYLAQIVVVGVSMLMSLLIKLPIVGNRINRRFVTNAIRPIKFEYPSDFFVTSLFGLVINDKSFFRMRNLPPKEPETLKLLCQMTSDDVLWDIGANIGQVTLPVGKATGASIYSFEPDPGNFFILANNVFLNDLSGNVRLLNIALNDKDEIVTLPFNEGNVGFALAGRSKLSVSGNDDGAVSGLRYPAISGDALVELYRESRPTYIKLDVDGNELKILAGMDEVLRGDSVTTIIVEAVFSGPEANSDQICSVLSAYGFVRNENEEATNGGAIRNMIFRRASA